MTSYLNFENLFFNYHKTISVKNRELFKLQKNGEGRPINLTLHNAESYTLEFEQYLQKRPKKVNLQRSTRRGSYLNRLHQFMEALRVKVHSPFNRQYYYQLSMMQERLRSFSGF
jgi:hypothetical protein